MDFAIAKKVEVRREVVAGVVCLAAFALATPNMFQVFIIQISTNLPRGPFGHVNWLRLITEEHFHALSSNVFSWLVALNLHWPAYKYARYKLTIKSEFLKLSLLMWIYFILQGGIYLYKLLDWYTAVQSLAILAAFEIVVICWIFGPEKIKWAIL